MQNILEYNMVKKKWIIKEIYGCDMYDLDLK